jgi:hypothetical protein
MCTNGRKETFFMRYVVTYSRTALRLPDGRLTTDAFLVRDREAAPPDTYSAYATRAEATIVAATLNGQ